METLSEIYDRLYEEAKILLNKYQPCKIIDGKCTRGKPCCGGCRYLSKNGCIAKALYCKVWLCSNEFPVELIEGLRRVEREAEYYHLLRYRSGKEDSLKSAEKVNKQLNFII